MATHPERAGPVLRLRVRRSDDSWVIEKQIPIAAMTLPPSSSLPEGHGRPVSGFWYEAADPQGRVVYRRVMDDPTEDSVEVPAEDGEIQRVSVERPEVVFDILVPDLPEVSELRIFAQSKRKPKSQAAQVRMDEPAARLPIREKRQQ
jgi:hypothetical protein